MTQPVGYSVSTLFQQEETNAVAGRSTVRTSALDAELQAISTTLSQTLANLALIQRDDTQLKDLVVTTASLSANVKALFAGGINPRGTWLTATAYAVKDVVETLTPLVSYICVVAHTSGVFATDRTAGKWMVLGQEPGSTVITDLTLTTGGITLGTNNTQDLAATANRFRSGYFGTTVFAGTSVVTPLVTTGAAVNLALGINGASNWIIPAGTLALRPAADNSQDFGDPAFRIGHIFTPIIDSGTAGPASINVNNGQNIAQFRSSGGTAVNSWMFEGGAVGTGIDYFAQGTDANIGITGFTKGTGGFNFNTNVAAAVTQFQVLHTASANRNITVTGSNGGNPTLSTTAGSLAITPAVVLAASLQVGTTAVISGASLQVGTNPASATAVIGVPYNTYIGARNSVNGADLPLVIALTQNAVTDLIKVGSSSSNGVIFRGRTGGAAPTTTDLQSGEAAVWYDTGGNTVKVYFNKLGTIFASAAFT